jgi:serine/threonine protein kinase
MHSPTDREAERIFVELLDLEPTQRGARLEQACAGNEAMRLEVQALLEACERSESYFEALRQRLGLPADTPAVGPAGLSDGTTGDPAGRSLGPYTLTHRLGRGGMGDVWCAQRTDGRFEGRVAIKLLAAPGAATRRSFEREARHLARLTHPNIARLLDAGAMPDGRPYLVLEFVEGEPIDRYCNGRRLTIDGRVRLFLQVLAGIAHAHANLVVHRDIKPSNVWVTPQGQGKVLDFGISKLIAGDETDVSGMATQTLALALTPLFAAPEQIEGTPVTTATDVYALGLLLWWLVAGCTPRSGRDARSLVELRELAGTEPGSLYDSVVRTRAPAALAETAQQRGVAVEEFRRTLRGDLDSVLRKAVAVDPRDRYPSAGDFALDLQRWLDHQPVAARPASAGYHLRMFVRRHRGSLAVAALMLTALVTAYSYAVWQGIEARQQRDLATYQQWRAQTANEFLGFLITDLAADGRPVSMADLLDRGAAMVETRAEAAPPPWAGPVLYELASAYFTLDMPARTAELLLRAEAASLAREDHDLRAAILCTRARMALRADPATARALVAEAQALPVRRGGLSAELLASCGRARALLLELDGDRPAAIQALQTTLAEVHAVAPELRRPRFWLLNELARLHYDHRDLPAALEVNRELLAQMDAAGLARSLGYLVVGLNSSSILTALGEIVESHRLQTQLTERLQGLAPAARPKGFVLPQATNLVRLVRYDAALRLVEQDEAALRAAGEPASSQHALMKARVLVQLGRTDEGALLLDAAEADLRKSPRRNDRLLEASALVRVQLTRAQGNLIGAASEAETLLQRMSVTYGTSPSPNLLHALKLASQVALDRKDAEAAMRYADNAVAIAGRMARRPTASADVGQALLLRAQAHRALGDGEQAAADLEAALPALTHGLGADHPDTAEARRLAAAR